MGHMQQFSRVVENSLSLMSLVITCATCDRHSEDCLKCAQWLSTKQNFMLTQSIYNELSLYYVVGQLKLAVSSGLLVPRTATAIELVQSPNTHALTHPHTHKHIHALHDVAHSCMCHSKYCD